LNDIRIFALCSFLALVGWIVWMSLSHHQNTSSVVKLRLALTIIPTTLVSWPWYTHVETISPGPWLWFAWVVIGMSALSAIALFWIVVTGRGKPGDFEVSNWAAYLWLFGLSVCPVGWIAAIVTFWAPVQ